MPWMHRLACFRDDVVFLIFLYQRHIYPVDKTRVNEFGQSFEDPGASNGPEAEASTGPEAEASTEPEAETSTGPEAEASTGPETEASTGPATEAPSGTTTEASAVTAPEASVGPQAEASAELKEDIFAGVRPYTRKTLERKKND